MQPIWYEGLGIVFNGEIYNYKSLRRNLKKLGYSFKTNSDTEVFLKLFHHYGYKAFSMINGMFGVCIIDLKKKKIVICRDRIGKKPLYYYKKKGLFIFSSEIKAIISVLTNRLKINLTSVDSFLATKFIASPQTIWDGINKLEPAKYLVFDIKKENFKIYQYWQNQIDSAGLKEYSPKQFKELFSDSVKIDKHRLIFQLVYF